MRPVQFAVITLATASMLVLSACSGEAPSSKYDNSQIKPAENKMVILPEGFRTGMAVIHPPRAKDGFGDTKLQTIGSLNGLHDLLKQRGLNLGNVMSIRANLAPGANGTANYDGFMAGFNEVFDGKKIASKPALALVAARSLPVSGQYVMLEVDIAIPVKTKPAAPQE